MLRVGEDVFIRSLDSGHIEVREDFGCGNKIAYFKTFAKMFEKYEEIKEPLIKDWKISKAVRAWAEVVNVKTVAVAHSYEGKTIITSKNGAIFQSPNYIEIEGDDGFAVNDFSIAELCGEEECES